MASTTEDFTRRLVTLTDRFAGLAVRLADAARELEVSGRPPADVLLDEVAGARSEFADLRARVFDAARAASVPVPPLGEVEGLRALEPVLRTVREALAAEEKRRAIAEVRRRALEILDRVVGMSHQDDPSFPALVQCKSTAEEIRAVVADPAAFERENPEAIIDRTLPFTALLTLIDTRDVVDDEKFAALEDTVTQAFGRSLAVAATRGKLIAPGSAPAPERPAAPPAPPRAASPPPPPHQAIDNPPRPAPTAVVPAAASPPQVVPASPAPAAPTVAAREDAGEAEAGRTVDETGRWWVSAWARWTSWKSTLSFSDAVKQELGKYSYLMSVPIQKSTDYEEGLLSYGYSILLEYLERQNAGFIAKALNSLKAVTPGAPGQPQTVGAHLYRFLVTEGRLSAQYPDFVKAVLAAAVPEPGVWTTARVLESTMETRIFTHPSNRIGDTEHNSQRLTQDRQRFTDHRFQVGLAPLTTRFFAVAADLREPRAVEVKLSDGRTESDHAWLLTMPPAGRADLKAELVRLTPEGSQVPGLGKDYATLWIAVFNPDPDAETRYDLTLGLRKDVRPPSGGRPARSG